MQYDRLQVEMYGQLESCKYGKIRPNRHSVTSSHDITKFKYLKYFSLRKHIIYEVSLMSRKMLPLTLLHYWETIILSQPKWPNITYLNQSKKIVMTSQNDVIKWIFFKIFGENFFSPKLIPVAEWSESDFTMFMFKDGALQTLKDKICWQNYRFHLKIKSTAIEYPLPPYSNVDSPKFQTYFTFKPCIYQHWRRRQGGTSIVCNNWCQKLDIHWQGEIGIPLCFANIFVLQCLTITNPIYGK